MSEARINGEDEFARQTAVLSGIAQALSTGGYELEPTTFETVKSFEPGKPVHGTLTKTADGKLAFTPDPAPPTLSVRFGYDWRKEQRAIAEESRYQLELQAKMDAAREELVGQSYVTGKTYLDNLVQVPDLKSGIENPPDLHKLLDEGMKMLLESAGIPEGKFLGKTHTVGEDRVQMREDFFVKRIIPPLRITNDELDRSVPTKPTPGMYPRNPNGYLKHCRLYNNFVKGTAEPPIPDAEMIRLANAVMVVELSEQALFAAKHQGPEVQAATRERLERSRAILDEWIAESTKLERECTDPALGLPHVERVAQDEDCGAVVVTTEGKPCPTGSGPSPAPS